MVEEKINGHKLGSLWDLTDQEVLDYLKWQFTPELNIST